MELLSLPLSAYASQEMIYQHLCSRTCNPKRIRLHVSRVTGPSPAAFSPSDSPPSLSPLPSNLRLAACSPKERRESGVSSMESPATSPELPIIAEVPTIADDAAFGGPVFLRSPSGIVGPSLFVGGSGSAGPPGHEIQGQWRPLKLTKSGFPLSKMPSYTCHDRS